MSASINSFSPVSQYSQSRIWDQPRPEIASFKSKVNLPNQGFDAGTLAVSGGVNQCSSAVGSGDCLMSLVTSLVDTVLRLVDRLTSLVGLGSVAQGSSSSGLPPSGMPGVARTMLPEAMGSSVNAQAAAQDKSPLTQWVEDTVDNVQDFFRTSWDPKAGTWQNIVNIASGGFSGLLNWGAGTAREIGSAILGSIF